MEKRWQFAPVEEGLTSALTEQLHISPILAQILANRGIADVEEGRHFLQDTLNDMADPFLMDGMETAVRRLKQAVEDKERIVIYGDYDVDGITSTSLVYSVLRDLGASPQFYIPERQSEGYGLNEEALQHLEHEADVLITVDCGISSYELVREFSPHLDIIITDHHEPPEKIPPALAVLNPKKPGCPYPFKELAGAGVAYVLCRALWQRCCNEDLAGYSDLSALGTIADLVPLIGENRIIVRQGLELMKKGQRTGLYALLRASGLVDKEITAGRIAFTAAPRLNAAGRISHATKGVELLLETDDEKAAAAAAELSELNAERQDIEHTIAKEASPRSKAGSREGTASSLPVMKAGTSASSALPHRASSKNTTVRLWSSPSATASARARAGASAASICTKPCSRRKTCSSNLAAIRWQPAFPSRPKTSKACGSGCWLMQKIT